MSPPPMAFAAQSPFQVAQAPLNAAPPLNHAAPLFKAVAGESFQASPFSAAQGTPQMPALTVGDVLPQMPPEVARMTALPPDHPVALPPEVIENALRSGQPAVPLFEIWRVCPALFQTPVSPQDPRLIPLPAAKLPRLIATAQTTRAQPGAFAGGGETPASAPMLMPREAPPPGAAGTALPPRRNGPPPALVDAASPFSVSLPERQPVSAGVQAPLASPFSQAGPGGAGQVLPSPFRQEPKSPFATVEPQAAPPANGSPYAPVSPPEPAVQPETAVPVSAPPMNGQAGASPFTALFGPKAVPTGQPAPDAPARPSPFAPAAPSSSVPPATAPAPGGGGPVRLSVAALLRGYTVAELGFDPMIIPGWIMTVQPAHEVRQWAGAASPLLTLGTLVDNITDVGFRNVLNNARRDFQVQLPREELLRALQGESPPTLPTLAHLKPAAPMMVTPQQQDGASPMTVPPGGLFAAPPPVSVIQPQPPAVPLPGASPAAFAPPAGFPVPGDPMPPQVENASPPEPASAFLQPPAQSVPPPQAAPQETPFTHGPSQSAASPTPTPAFFAPPSAPAAPFAPPPSQAPAPFAPPPVENPAPPPAAVAPPAVPVAPPAPAVVQAPSPMLAPSPLVPDLKGFGSAELLGAGMIPGAPAAPAYAPQAARAEPPVFPVIEPAETSPAPGTPASSVEIPAPSSRAAGQAPAPALGIQAADSRPDQIVLRALLGTDEELTPQRVVEMTCALPGIAACVCLQGERALSHIGARKPQAREFQKQATSLSHHLRSLAPLIGIEGAETFTLTSGDRLMTFCFPEKIILAILHDAEPSFGLRDKITLIARELSRMLA